MEVAPVKVDAELQQPTTRRRKHQYHQHHHHSTISQQHRAIMRTNGKYVVHALEHIGEPTTLAALVACVAQQTNNAPAALEEPVRQVLRKGLAYGFVERLQAKYYLTSSGGDCAGAADRRERRNHRASLLLSTPPTAPIHSDVKPPAAIGPATNGTAGGLGLRLERMRRVFGSKVSKDGGSPTANKTVATAGPRTRTLAARVANIISADVDSVEARSTASGAQNEPLPPQRKNRSLRVAGVLVERPPRRRRPKLLMSAIDNTVAVNEPDDPKLKGI